MACVKVTENGKILVYVSNKEIESEVKQSLMSTISGNFCLDEVK